MIITPISVELLKALVGEFCQKRVSRTCRGDSGVRAEDTLPLCHQKGRD